MVDSPTVETSEEQSLAGSGTPSLGVHEVAVASGAGLLGTLAMLPFLGAAWLLGALSPAAFAGLAELLGADPASPLAFPLGAALFVGGGASTLALLFVSLAEYLPPERSVGLRGVAFALIVWTGFVVAFWTGQTGGTLAVYALATLAAHAAYGYTLGTLYDRYADVPSYSV